MSSSSHESTPSGDTPDDDLLRLFEDFDTQFTARECLRSSLYDKLIELDSHAIVPDLEMTEATNVPFGALSETMLSGDLHRYSDGTMRGWLRISGDSDNHPLPMIKRDPRSKRWEGPIYDEKREIFTDEGVLHKLEKHWPWNSYDNTTIREAAAHPSQDPSADLYIIFRDELKPHAEQYVSIREYAQVRLVADETGTILSPSATKLQTRNHYYGDGLSEYTVCLEHTVQTEIDGLPTALTVVVEISDEGNIAIEAHYKHPETGEPIEQSIDDEVGLVAELIAALNQLVADALASQRS